MTLNRYDIRLLIEIGFSSKYDFLRIFNEIYANQLDEKTLMEHLDTPDNISPYYLCLYEHFFNLREIKDIFLYKTSHVFTINLN